VPDRASFTLRQASDLVDQVGLRFGDRVELRIYATVVQDSSTALRDGTVEHVAVLEAYAGEVVAVLDRLPGGGVSLRVVSSDRTE
jgi:hypothetical protein